MKLFFSLSISLILSCFFNIKSEIIVRPVQSEDLPGILEVDKKVTREHFIPLLTSTYNYLNINRSAEEDLENEIIEDEKTFPDYINPTNNTKLYGAFDSNTNKPYGLIIFHKADAETIMIDLIEVDQDYTNQKIGKKLFKAAIGACKNITRCMLYTIQHYNENTIAFYKSLGFKDPIKGPKDQKTPAGVSYHDIYFFYEIDINSLLPTATATTTATAAP